MKTPLKNSKFKHGGAGYWVNGKKTRPWPEYSVWSVMKGRCLNPKNKDYKDYGGRGIKIHPSWVEDFGQFISDIGRRPPGMTLDRINNDGNYEPGNCRWASRKEQARNKRNNLKLTYQGRAQTLSAWAEEIGLDPLCLYGRYLRGEPVNRILAREHFKSGPQSKLSAVDIDRIIRWAKVGYLRKEIAKAVGLDARTISTILNKRGYYARSQKRKSHATN